MKFFANLAIIAFAVGALATPVKRDPVNLVERDLANPAKRDLASLEGDLTALVTAATKLVTDVAAFGSSPSLGNILVSSHFRLLSNDQWQVC